MMILTPRSDSSNILKCYQRMLQLQNSWKRCDFVQTEELKSELINFYADHGFQNSIEISPASMFMRYTSVSDMIVHYLANHKIENDRWN